MKKTRLMVAIIAILTTLTFTAQAQAPYKASIGITAGNMQALSFKAFGGSHFAFQVDLGTKVTKVNPRINNVQYSGWEVWDLELNPNIMFEGHLTKGLYGLVGIGGSIGYSWNTTVNTGWWIFNSTRSDLGKCGGNAIVGFEYKFKAPIAMQLDFRPGYGCLFAEHFDAHYFDWGVNLGIRYTL